MNRANNPFGFIKKIFSPPPTPVYPIPHTPIIRTPIPCTVTHLTLDDVLSRYANVSKQPQPLYTNIVLSGGSIKGISHVGALARLQQAGLIDFNHIKAVAGASAGAVVAMYLVLGYKLPEIWQAIVNIDVANLIQPAFMMFITDCGVETGAELQKFFERVLREKTGIDNITFQELYQYTDREFIVVGSCLTTKKVVYYDHVRTPHFRVALALRISVSIPGFFVPVDIDGEKYIDGGVLDNYPITVFKHDLQQTIGILICNEYSTNYKTPEEFLMAIYNLFMDHFCQKSYREEPSVYNTVLVDKVPDNLSNLDFCVDAKTKVALLEAGIQAVDEFVRRKMIIF